MQTLKIKRDPQHSWLLWWSPDGGRKWYPVNGKNVQPMPEGNRQNPFEAFKGFREAMNRVLAGCEESFLGEYDRARGVLKLKASASATLLTVSRRI